MKKAPNIDFEVIEELKELADVDHPEFFREQMELFFSGAETLIKELKIGFSERSHEKICRAAHRLNGSAGIAGAIKLQQICASLEEMGDGVDFEKNINIIDLIKHEFESAKEVLQAEVLR